MNAEDTPLALDRLGDEFCRVLRALGHAGEPQAASHHAARAWWAVRDVAPSLADHINGVMHHLATLEAGTVIYGEEPQMAEQNLDVRDEPPARRHELILSTYHELEPGTGFALINDHDPKPLYYQFAAEYPDQFTWDYLEEGPEVWRVRIGRPREE